MLTYLMFIYELQLLLTVTAPYVFPDLIWFSNDIVTVTTEFALKNDA